MTSFRTVRKHLSLPDGRMNHITVTHNILIIGVVYTNKNGCTNLVISHVDPWKMCLSEWRDLLELTPQVMEHEKFPKQYVPLGEVLWKL